MNRQERNLARHFQRLQGTAGVAVTYSRGAASVEIALAVPGQTPVSIEDEAGVSIRGKRADWIIMAADLVLGGVAVLPEVGDQIRVAAATGTAVYEVQRLAGEGHCVACDQKQTAFRIHTRLINTETP